MSKSIEEIARCDVIKVLHMHGHHFLAALDSIYCLSMHSCKRHAGEIDDQSRGKSSESVIIRLPSGLYNWEGLVADRTPSYEQKKVTCVENESRPLHAIEDVFTAYDPITKLTAAFSRFCKSEICFLNLLLAE